MPTATGQSIIVPRNTLLPPPRPGVRHVRAPFLGIVIADDELRRSVNRRFHWPMIVLALFVLPLLAWELLWPPTPWTGPWWLSAITMGVIWTAFVAEFIIKIAIAESRLEYIRRNWLDLVIIAMPALRPLRAASIARTTRVFALRGVGMKFVRYVFTVVVGMEATDRLLHRFGVRARRDRKDPIQMTRHELTMELQRLRRLADAWEQWHAQHVEHRDQHEPGSGSDLPATPTCSGEPPAEEASSDCHTDSATTIAPPCESPSRSSTRSSVTCPETRGG